MQMLRMLSCVSRVSDIHLLHVTTSCCNREAQVLEHVY